MAKFFCLEVLFCYKLCLCVLPVWLVWGLRPLCAERRGNFCSIWLFLAQCGRWSPAPAPSI